MKNNHILAASDDTSEASCRNAASVRTTPSWRALVRCRDVATGRSQVGPRRQRSLQNMLDNRGQRLRVGVNFRSSLIGHAKEKGSVARIDDGGSGSATLCARVG